MFSTLGHLLSKLHSHRPHYTGLHYSEARVFPLSEGPFDESRFMTIQSSDSALQSISPLINLHRKRQHSWDKAIKSEFTTLYLRFPWRQPDSWFPYFVVAWSLIKSLHWNKSHQKLITVDLLDELSRRQSQGRGASAEDCIVHTCSPSNRFGAQSTTVCVFTALEPSHVLLTKHLTRWLYDLARACKATELSH